MQIKKVSIFGSKFWCVSTVSAGLVNRLSLLFYQLPCFFLYSLGVNPGLETVLLSMLSANYVGILSCFDPKTLIGHTTKMTWVRGTDRYVFGNSLEAILEACIKGGG